MKGIKFLILSVFVFILLLNLAYAQSSKLIFSDVDVSVGGKSSKNLNDNDIIDEEAEPGDKVEFKIELLNNFTRQENLEIEDVTVEVTIEGIDDGDDLEEEASEFDLDPGEDKRVNIEFQVPLEVEEDDFDVVIRAEGEDENGTNHEAEMRLRLEVNKENHLLKITRASLTPAEVTCGRKNVQLSTTIINIGNEDEEEVVVEVSNTELGVDLEDNIEELQAEPNEEESRYSNVFSFSVPANAESGSYPILLRALYDDGRRKAEQSLTLTVNDCLTAPPTTQVTKETNEEVVLVTPPTTKTTTTQTETTQLPPGTVVTQESFFRSDAFVTGIIVAEVIAIIVGIVLVIYLFRR